jgi:uncharacterized protein YifE (UPF0438 family)
MNIELYGIVWDVSLFPRDESRSHGYTIEKKSQIDFIQRNGDSYSEFKSINNKLKKNYNNLFVAAFVF